VIQICPEHTQHDHWHFEFGGPHCTLEIVICVYSPLHVLLDNPPLGTLHGQNAFSGKQSYLAFLVQESMT